MVYPTRLTILLAAAIAPLALAIGVLAPGFWTAGLGLLALLIMLCGFDALAGAAVKSAELGVQGRPNVSVSETFSVTLRARFPGSTPRRVEFALGLTGPAAAPFGHQAVGEPEAGGSAAAVVLIADRRGTIGIEGIWARWPGPLGLVWKQKYLAFNDEILVTPDIRPVRDKGVQLLNREAMYGLMAQFQIGEGAELEALADFRQGMDRRAIDWKQSARHTHLIAKEFRTERNNNIVMAIDAGRAMCEPIADVPRIDRAVSAALLTAYVALKDGDRIGMFAFDSRPRASSNPISGPRAFSMLQRVASRIDYSDHETNYTLALSTLAASLSRRSLIVVFTEFADTISAELMLAALGPLLKRHLVLFVVMRDEELEAFTAADPETAEDVSRAVTAASLLRERRLVLTRLRHLGVHLVEARAAEAGPALVNAYLDLKRRNLL